MKKIKWFSLILCVIMLALTACSSTDTSSMFEENAPWTKKNATCKEIARYEFSRYLTGVEVNPDHLDLGEDKDKGYKLNSSGSLTYTLTEGKSVKLEGGEVEVVANTYHTLIKTELNITYKSDLTHTNEVIQSVYAGKTDSVTSYTVLDRYTLASLFTHKTTDIQTQAEADTMSYILTCDYTGDFLGSRKAVLEDKGGTKEISIKSGTYYDSESIYYQIRAMRSVGAAQGATRAFSIATPYNDALTGERRLKAKSAQQNSENDENVGISQDLLRIFNTPEETDENGNPIEITELKCYKTVLTLTEDKPGPPINLCYSRYATIPDGKSDCLFAAEKVLIKIDYPNHDKLTNSVYNQEFILSSYSNSDTGIY